MSDILIPAGLSKITGEIVYIRYSNPPWWKRIFGIKPELMEVPDWDNVVISSGIMTAYFEESTIITLKKEPK